MTLWKFYIFLILWSLLYKNKASQNVFVIESVQAKCDFKLDTDEELVLGTPIVGVLFVSTILCEVTVYALLENSFKGCFFMSAICFHETVGVEMDLFEKLNIYSFGISKVKLPNP